MRVLVAEDEPLARHLVEATLRRWGYETISVSDGNEAWREMQKPDAPETALLDWMMPGMTGPELCGKLRRRKGGGYVYLILLTGKAGTRDIVKGLDAGADDYVTKPFEFPELKARLRVAERMLDLHARVVQEHQAREAAQKRHAEEMAEREQRLAAILSSLHEAMIVVHDRDGKVKHAWHDRKLDDSYGIEIERIVGHRLTEFFLPDDGEGEMAAFRGVFDTGRPSRTERRYRLPTGQVWHDVSLCPMAARSGEIVAVVGFMHDITRRKRLQEELHQARKLQSVGQLAAGIAHEINTPLQYISDNVQFVRESLRELPTVISTCQSLLESCQAGVPSPERIAEVQAVFAETDIEFLLRETPEAVEQSLEGIGRVTEIVRAMRDFSGPRREGRTFVDINQSVEGVITICRNEWKYVAEVESDLDADLPPIRCLSGELNQVILELIANAAHAIGAVVGDDPATKGTIRVSTRRDGDWAEIRVSDTGTGIPEEIRPRIFDPFFTTREIGQGTGQGLTIVHSIVVGEQAGSIEFDTEMGKGTTFTIRLPLNAPMPRRQEPATEVVSA